MTRGARAVSAVPASSFGVVLGLSGLGTAWRAAHEVWQLPSAIGETLELAASVVWAALLIAYALKWIVAHEHARAEVVHPVQCCFVGLIGVATLLVAGAVVPYAHPVAELLLALGIAWTLVFAVWRTGGLWRGARDHGATTAVLYLPTVAGSFVTAAVAASLGHADWGQFAFGAGLFSWLAIESVLLHRLYVTSELPPALRPTLGIQLAPPTVGAVAYIAVSAGPADLFAHALIGYGILQALVLLRLLPWILQQPFALSYWAFTFGISALAIAPLRLVARGDAGPIALMAPYVFVAANLAIGVVVIGTLWLAVRGRLLPMPAPVAR